jgi:replicative DNA helicase
MLIDKNLVVEAKEKLGEKAAILIKDYFDLKNWEERNLKGSCPWHSDSTPSFLWNPKNQSYHCFSCNRNYGVIDLLMDQGKLTYLGAVEKLFEMVGIEYKFSEKGVRVKDYKYPNYEDHDRTKVIEYWGKRGISKETLDYCDITADAHGNTAFNYYDTNDVLTMVKYRPSRKVNKGENKMWAQKDADTKPLLYNMNKISFDMPLLICEGEGDCLSAIEAGYQNSVSVPFGAQTHTWIQENFEWLENFEKIVLWFDGDKSGIEARKEATHRIGIWKIKYVDTPSELENTNGEKVKIKDINEVLFVAGKQFVLDLISNAQEMPMTGVEDLATVDDFDLEKAPGLYSCLDPVDNIIYKFLLGSVVLFTGIKGSGKSTLINQIFLCEALNQGLDAFVFSGELDASVLKTWLEMTMAGREKVTLKNNFIHVIDSESKKEMRKWYSERVWVYDQEENTSEAVLDRAIAVTRKYGVKVWILDNLMTLDIGETDSGNTLQKQKEFIVKLVRLAKMYGVLIVLVGHPRKIMANAKITSDDISGSGNLGNMVQYILSIHRYSEKEKKGEKGQNGKYKANCQPIEHDVEVSVLKNRYTGKVGSARLYFDYTAYRFYSKPPELWKRYKWSKDTSPMPTKDPNIHKEEPDFLDDEPDRY